MLKKPHPSFLVVDHHAEGRLLISRTLLRKLPGAVLHECDTLDLALSALANTPVDVIVSHRVIGYDGPTTVRFLRAANATVPIIMVSGANRVSEAVAAGADAFVHFDAWLTIGSVAEKLLQAKMAPKREETDPTPA